MGPAKYVSSPTSAHKMYRDIERYPLIVISLVHVLRGDGRSARSAKASHMAKPKAKERENVLFMSGTLKSHDEGLGYRGR